MTFEIDHLGIAVRNVEEALRFYQEVLGMSVSGRETVTQERVNIAMLAAGSAPDAPRLELLEATDEESAIARFVQKRGPGLHHIALRVDDLEATANRLAAAGARLLNEARRGAAGHTYIFVHPASTGGVLLELIQEEKQTS